MRTYSATKLLTVLFTTESARRLAGSGVSVNAADPGFVRSALGRDATGGFGLFLKIMRPFQRTPTRGAATPLYLATSPEVAGASGGYFANNRPAKTSPLAQDQATAQRAWDFSNELLTRKAPR
jgi:retinol dehydrogenase-14